MNSDISRLMDNLRVRVPGSSDAALRLELFNVVLDFCSDTNIWQQDIDVLITPGVTEYELIPEGIAYINRLMSITDADGRSVNATMPIPGTLALSTAPNEAQTYTARVALTITDPVTRDDYPVLPDWIWSRHNQDFQDGVQAKMFSQIAKPYSNERMAIFHMRNWSDSKARARVEARHHFSNEVQRWRFPQTFNARRSR